ncbi:MULTISPECIES: hypothetical protein [Rhodomicrobium]|uniref:hypothetical protein n=1 Tax=Rhodomicrobium TaxID=1068 RepID=UPI000F73C3BB|nr:MULTISPECIES: hypothetical protein [Rhodomicrobium]
MLSILNALSAAFRFLTGLAAFLSERRQIQAGEDRAAARSLKEQARHVQTARAARRRVDSRSLPEHDPDRRD